MRHHEYQRNYFRRFVYLEGRLLLSDVSPPGPFTKQSCRASRKTIMNRRIFTSAFVFTTSAVLITMLTGCATLQVKLGMRVDLAKLPITAMAATLPQDPGIAPGEKNPVLLTFTEANGKVLKTSGIGKGKVMWRQITVTPSVVTVNKKGVLHLAADPRVSDGKTGHVDITVPTHPDLHASLDLPLHYDDAFRAAYSGASGTAGTDGQDGSDGSSGSDGSTDPDNPSAGGNGGDGGNGTDGTNGSDGDNGPAVQVLAALHPGTKLLVEIAVTVAGKTKFFLVDPNGGTLAVSSDGGSGGSGGHGGRGGSGGSGGSGIPSGMNGNSGLDGQMAAAEATATAAPSPSRTTPP